MNGQTNRCFKCSKIKKLKKYKNQYYCNACYNKYCKPQKKCIDCGKITYVEKYEKHGPVCSTCYLKYKKKELCYICNEMGIVGKRTENGIACKRCYNRFLRVKEKCIICEKKKVVNYRSENGPICKSCYKVPKDICSICKQKKRTYKRIKKTIICKKCYFKHRYKNDEKFNILHKLRSRTQAALNSYISLGKTKKSKEYNINYEKIIEHLGPSPGKEYHIDHIFPLSAFNLNDIIHVEAAFAPENHQWLLAKENFSKNAKFNKKEWQVYIDTFIVSQSKTPDFSRGM